MDITPRVHLLRTWERQKPNYPLLFCEAVDNAFDASATRIRIIHRSDKIQFEDDGIGIKKEIIPALFTPGRHEPLTSTRLGQFGIGITSQAIAAGRKLEVETISNQGGLSAEAEWAKIIRSGDWRIDDALFIPTVVGQHSGTTLTVSGLRPSRPIPTEKIISELADRFHPALLEGRSIILNGMPIAIVADPRIKDIVEKEFVFDDSRNARLRAGILIDTSKRNRVHVSYHHRVIRPADSFACGEYGG